nr:amino acid permease [Salmonella sp. NCTC 7297]
MSSDADAHKVGLIPVTLMVSGNIMGSGVFLLPANLAATGGIAIYGWLVTIIGALALSMVYAKMSSLDPSPGGSYAYARRCFGPFLGYQTNVLYWLACWIGNIAMVVIGVGYLSYFFPILKDPLVLTLTCVAVLWIFRSAEHRRAENDYPRAGRRHRTGAGAYRRDCGLRLVLV